MLLKLLIPLAALAAITRSVSATPYCKVFYKASDKKWQVQNEINKFLNEIGGVDNASAPGDQGSGFRSINWDAGIVPFDFPSEFFNEDVTRGIIFNSK